MGRRSRATPNARVNAAKPRVENVLKLREREIRDLQLADLRDDDEAFACHVESMRDLDVTSKNEHQTVARPEPIVIVNRPRKIRVEL